LLPRDRHDYILAHGSVATLLFILLLTVLHERQFGVRWGDSINRMSIYLVPTFGFYLLMSYGRAPFMPDRTRPSQ
jgi:hypothetical protein